MPYAPSPARRPIEPSFTTIIWRERERVELEPAQLPNAEWLRDLRSRLGKILGVHSLPIDKGCKEEKYPSRINNPSRRRTPETESLATGLTFSSCRAAYAAFGDGDLIVDLGRDGVVVGARCHYCWLFRHAASMESSCSFHTKQNYRICLLNKQEAYKTCTKISPNREAWMCMVESIKKKGKGMRV